MRAGVAVVAAVVVLAGCGTEAPPPRTVTASDATAAAGQERLPDGWRWESYAGVELGVPGDWGWGNGSQRLSQWCVDEGDASRLAPIVARPGVATLVGCPPAAPGQPDPSTLVAHTGLVAAFEPAYDGMPPLRDQGDQGVRRIGDVVLRVNAPAALRERVLATAHAFTGDDANGCPAGLPTAYRPGDPPPDARDVSTLTGVTALAACRYALPQPGETDRTTPLLSSIRLEGDAAADVVRAVQRAPEGGGPDAPRTCLADGAYGEEMVVARIDSDQGTTSVAAYFSGCDHNGFDDGVTHRVLTRAALQPLLAGGNAPTSWSGPDRKSAMIQPSAGGTR